MGHYDECRDGYCPSCGASPGNIINGKCEFCHPKLTKQKKKMSVEVIGKDPKVYKQCTCHNCASILKYTMADVVTKVDDYLGGTGKYIACPACNTDLCVG